MTEKLIVDGNWAAADVAYRVSEFSAIYPITPSSTMGELVDEWAFRHKKNIWGSIPGVIEMESEGGAAGALHGALQMGALATTFTASQGLLLMIPNMYKIAGEQTPFVMHVAARALATHALSIFGDHSDVMAVRQTGFAMLSGANVQQAHDMAAIAHAASLRSRVPFLHFFDGFRTSHEESRLEYIPDDVLKRLIPQSDLLANRARGMTPNAPTIRGTAQNPDVYFQGREAANTLYDAVPEITAGVMREFEKLTGRKYGLVDYVGDKNADKVIVVMGSASETIAETLPHLPKKTGMIVVHLFRPFPTAAFLDALPKTTKQIAVLDRTKEPGALGEPLYQDVVTAINQILISNLQPPISIYGGRYGLGSKEFKPRDVKAIVEYMMRRDLKHNFTVGINDDVTNLSLKTDPAFTIEACTADAEVCTFGLSALLYGIGSDGTVGAAKNIVKIVGENSDLYPQSYAVYDSKKSGGLTASHLRFSDAPIRSQYLVENADFISVSNFMIAGRFDIFNALKPGGTVLINTSHEPAVAFANLPRETQEHLLRLRAHVYFIDANGAAAELGLGNRINTFMMLNFFNLTKLIDPDVAAKSAKDAIDKAYRKKGADVVAANWAAVDRASEFMHNLTLPSSPSNFAPDFLPAMTGDAPVRIAGILGEMAAMRGDDLPVSAFAAHDDNDADFSYGEYPVGTAKFEKRGISTHTATCDLSACIQCGKCSILCPHAVIRIHAAEKFPGPGEEVDGATGWGSGKLPVNFVPMKTPELGPDMMFNLSISPADCTGCGVCVRNCPVKALKMVPVADVPNQQAEFDAVLKLPPIDPSKLNLNIPKHLSMLEHMFEFPGACGGCGETPYIKLITQLFGDRMVVANATGCSSIYSGNLPTTPYTKNVHGRGPAWSNSLFEDNAQYGLGMRMALTQKQIALKSLLFEIADDIKLTDVEKFMAERDINKQRENEFWLRNVLSKSKHPRAVEALSLAEALVDKSVWIIGGDGWAYDIGYGGLDHILHSAQNVNILVLDTEGYSNTGGQKSKATPYGASMKFAVGGQDLHKKDLGLIAMMSGAYVAQIAMGADHIQAARAIREAESFDGPSIILAYSPCIAHGFDLKTGTEHQRMLVESGAWPLYRFDPRKIDDNQNPLMIDSGGDIANVADTPSGNDDNLALLEKFMNTESRFKAAKSMNPTRFAGLVQMAADDNQYRRELKKHIAKFVLDRPKRKINGQG